MDGRNCLFINYVVLCTVAFSFLCDPLIVWHVTEASRRNNISLNYKVFNPLCKGKPPLLHSAAGTKISKIYNKPQDFFTSITWYLNKQSSWLLLWLSIKKNSLHQSIYRHTPHLQIVSDVTNTTLLCESSSC